MSTIILFSGITSSTHEKEKDLVSIKILKPFYVFVLTTVSNHVQFCHRTRGEVGYSEINQKEVEQSAKRGKSHMTPGLAITDYSLLHEQEQNYCSEQLHLFVYVFMYSFIQLFICLFVCLFILFIYLFIYLFNLTQ